MKIKGLDIVVEHDDLVAMVTPYLDTIVNLRSEIYSKGETPRFLVFHLTDEWCNGMMVLADGQLDD